MKRQKCKNNEIFKRFSVMKEIHRSSPKGEDFLLIRPIPAKIDAYDHFRAGMMAKMTKKYIKKEFSDE